MPKAQPEYQLQCAVAQYLRAQYPNVMFRSDVGSQLRLTIPQAIRNRKIQPDDFQCPDLVIYEPKRTELCIYHGLFLELKAETPYKLNGELKKKDNYAEQWRDIQILREKGYHADFYWTFESCKSIIDWYLGGK